MQRWRWASWPLRRRQDRIRSAVRHARLGARPHQCGARHRSSRPNAGTIKIGILGPQTGPVAQYGIAVKNGAVLYLDQLNAAGGINGKQIEYIIYDEEVTPPRPSPATTPLWTRASSPSSAT